MATSFPTSIDALTNPTSANKLNDAGVIHADQHANANDAIKALEAKVGVDSSAVTTSLDYKIRNIPLSSITTGFGVNVATFLATPTSANLRTAVATTSTGTGSLVFASDPAITNSLTTPSTSFALINTVATTVTFAGAATSCTIGGTPTTGLTANIFNNSTASGSTKAINIGTGGASGSLTIVTIGPSTAGATGTTKLYTNFSVATPPAIITTTTYTVGVNDTVLVFNTTGACAVTMPSAASYPGRTITLKQIAAFAVTAVNTAGALVTPLTSVTAGTAILSGTGKFAHLVSDGTNWVTMMSN